MLTLQSGIELLVAAAGGIYIIGQIKATAEANKQGLETLKKDLTDLITKNNELMQDLFEAFKMHQTENLEREVRHIKDLMSINATETRDSIKRLEEAQRESNRIKSRLTMVEASVKSLHKRLDVEPSLPIGEDIE